MMLSKRIPTSRLATGGYIPDDVEASSLSTFQAPRGETERYSMRIKRVL